MIDIHAFWNTLYQPLHVVVRNPQELRRMSMTGDRVLQAIAGVARAMPSGRWEGEEDEWRKRIEALRAEMERSNEVLSIADYGAQSPLKRLTDEAMYRGRIVERTLGSLCRTSSKSPKWSQFLFRLIRALEPGTCLELGTCLGISGAYIGASMTMNGKGRLITIEGSDVVACRAVRNFRDLGLDVIETITGRFQDTLPDVLEKAGVLDMAFIDGHHDGPSTLRYFERIAPSLADHAVVIFDDIAWSSGMHDAWTTLQRHPRIRYAIDMFDMGLCVIGDPAKQHFRIAV